MRALVNPRLLSVRHVRLTIRSRGVKVYRAGFYGHGGYSVEKVSRREFRTATEAVEYGFRVLSRWQCLYDAAVLEVMG